MRVVTDETVGLFGRPAAGILEDAPEVVLVQRGKGYPWPPFAEVPEDHFDGASSVGKPVGTDWSGVAKYKALKYGAERRADLAKIDDDEAAYAALKEWYKPVDFEAMRFGSMVHLITARRDAGRTAPLSTGARMDGSIAAWEAWKDDYGIRFGAIERTLYAPEPKVAGTADRIAIASKPPKGWTDRQMFVVDLKTTGQELSKVKPSIEYVVQLTALAAASHIVYEETSELLELPTRIAGGALVYVTPEGYRCHWVDTAQDSVRRLVNHCVGALRAKRGVGRGVYGTADVRRAT